MVNDQRRTRDEKKRLDRIDRLDKLLRAETQALHTELVESRIRCLKPPHIQQSDIFFLFELKDTLIYQQCLEKNLHSLQRRPTKIMGSPSNQVTKEKQRVNMKKQWDKTDWMEHRGLLSKKIETQLIRKQNVVLK